MKKMAVRFLAVVLSLALILSFTAFAADSGDSSKLTFGSDGKFTILTVADMQDNLVLPKIEKSFIRDMLNEVQPDLVVLTGDNIAGYWNATLTIPAVDRLLCERAIGQFMSVFEEAGYPVAVVFGNHDDELTWCTKEEQVRMYAKYDCFIGYDEGSEIDGVCNNSFPVYDQTGSQMLYNIFTVDSNTYIEPWISHNYDGVHSNQLDWLKAANSQLNGVHSMVFQHMPVPEIYDYYTKVDEGTSGSVSKNGASWILPEGATGILGEGSCPTCATEEWSTLSSMGTIDAIVTGHDHVNSFVMPTDTNTDFIACPGVGFCSYGDSSRGVRVIEIDEATLDYESYAITYLEHYAGNSDALNEYAKNARELGIIDMFKGLFGLYA